jgi:hypothetical protein
LKPPAPAVRSLTTMRIRLLHKRLVACAAGSCPKCELLARATEALHSLLSSGQARLVKNLEATQELERWGYLNLDEEAA